MLARAPPSRRWRRFKDAEPCSDRALNFFQWDGRGQLATECNEEYFGADVVVHVWVRADDDTPVTRSSPSTDVYSTITAVNNYDVCSLI